MDPVTLGMAKSDAAKKYGAKLCWAFLDPSDSGVLRVVAADGGVSKNPVGDTVGDDMHGGSTTFVAGALPLLVGGQIPAKYGGGGTLSSARTNLTIGTGFATPSWGVAPSVMTVSTDKHLRGQIAAGSSSIVAGAVLTTGGTWTAGVKATAVTDTGVVLLLTTATQITVSQILAGSSPAWVSLDGVILA
ncbi:hypothetical protein RND64_04355 [Gordonia sp. w5E2]|uniref:hypothetical protein n=2 Tax=Gordonia TaxID=2053 RepID=UPI002F418031